MIIDLQTLRLALADYLDRDNLTPEQLDRFIENGRLCAAQYNAREQEQMQLLTLDAVLEAPLPARFIATRYVVTAAGVTVPQIESAFSSLGESGGYRIVGQKIRLSGGGLVAGSQVELHFYEYPQPLAAPTDSSPYLLANSDLWLWASIEDGARFQQNSSLEDTAAAARGSLGERVRGMGKAARQHGGPRRMVVTR
jgi:hypothetical protein